MESLESQVYAFIATIITGVVMGICFDYYRVLRWVYRPKKVGTCLGDMAFWLVTTILVFMALLMGNWGEVRLYVFIGLFMGIAVYFCLLSNPTRKLVRLKFFLFFKTWQVIIKTVLFLWMVISCPFRLVFLFLSYPVSLLKSLFIKARRKLGFVFSNYVGRRLERLAAKGKSKLAGLLLWKSKK